MVKENKYGIYYGYIVVASVFVVMASIWGTLASFGVFFESFIQEFGWTRMLTSGASSVRDLVFGVFCIITARATQKYGPRFVVSIGGIVLGVGYYLMSHINSVWQMYIYYGVIVSCGMSVYIPIISIVAQWFNRRRGMMTAVTYCGMSIGTMIMPPFANHLISAYGWRSSYTIISIIGFLLIFLAGQFLRLPSKEQGELITIKTASTDSTTKVNNNGLSFNQAIRTKQFWSLTALYFFFLYSVLTITVHIFIYSTGIGLSLVNAANILAIIGALCIVGNWAGLIADRFGSKRIMIVNFLIMTISFIWLLTAGNVWSLFLFSGLFGLSYGGIQVLFSPFIAELFGLKSHGMIFAAAAFGGTLGAALGPFITGFIFDISKRYNTAFSICLIMDFIGIFLTLSLRPVESESYS